MRVVLDVNVADGDHIEGTVSWAAVHEPVAFSGWLALMRLLEDAHSHFGNGSTLGGERPGHGTDLT